MNSIDRYLNSKVDIVTVIGRTFYGVAISGIGMMHFFYSGFRPVVLPLPHNASGIYFLLPLSVGAYITLSGIAITANRKTDNISFALGAVFFLLFIFGHLPIRLLNNPEVRASWVDTFKLLALSGGAFLIANASSHTGSNERLSTLKRYAVAGSFFFAVMLIQFGSGHLINAGKVSGIVPKYIPYPLFWTYVSGIALVAAGLCILFKCKLRLVGALLALVLFLWLIMLHLYYAFRFPAFQEGENIIGSFQCLAFCGTALVISGMKSCRKGPSERSVFL